MRHTSSIAGACQYGSKRDSPARTAAFDTQPTDKVEHLSDCYTP